MKKYLVAILAGLALTQTAYSQPEAQQIAGIDKILQETKMNIGSYQLIENLHADSAGTGHRRVYKNGKELKLITVEYKETKGAGNNIIKKVEWYFSNGHLIYSEVLWQDISTSKVVDNQKLYLDDKRLISWAKLNNEKVDTTSAEFKEMDATMRAYGISMANHE